MKQRPYRIPIHLNKVVNNQVNDMLDRGLIQLSNSPWSSPIVLAPKKDGDYRFCVDFRRVNSVTKGRSANAPYRRHPRPVGGCTLLQKSFQFNSKIFLLDQKIKIHILCYK